MKKLFFLALVVACSRKIVPPPQPDVTIGGAPRARIVLMTEALATKENGPAATIAKFGEVYAFVPSTVAVRPNEPTTFEFWNLQGDDEHDVMLLDRGNRVVVQFKLPPLQKTSRVFTFHARGIYRFVCTLHQPEMSGAIVVE